MRKISVLLAVVAALLVTEARADFTGKDATNTTITFKNPNTCSSVVCVPVSQPYDGTNLITFTTAGANGASNTLTGMPTYDRMNIFNGTTWDRWTGVVSGIYNTSPITLTNGQQGTLQFDVNGYLKTNVTNTNPNITPGDAIATGTYSGASPVIGAGLLWNGTTYDRAPGSTTGAQVKVASGGLASGAGTDGWDATQGAKADSVCGTDTGTCSLIALVKKTNSNISGSVPAGTNTIGQVGSDPSQGKATPTFAFLALPATTTTQIVALSGSTKIFVTSLMAFSGGTVNVTFKYGTGTNCGTGTTTLAGPYPLTAQAGFSLGAGVGPVMIVPSAQALCITTDASVSGGVQLTFQQI